MEEQWIASFWRRIGALLIDSLLLGGVGFVLGIALESTFVELGAWGRLIGFVIALLYFGFMNSTVANGQTFGKKLLKLRVVDASNNSISLTKSFVRYSIFATPFSLNGAHFTNEALLSYLIYPLSLIIFGGIFSTIYLYVFNRITRQSLHDLIVGTYVVNTNINKQELAQIWRPHLIVAALFFIASAIAPIFTMNLAQSKPFKGLLSTQTAITNNSAISYATVTSSITTYNSSSEESDTTTYVNVQAFLNENNVDDLELANNLANIVMTHYPDSKTKNAILITLTYGYDIGIWSQWSSYTHTFNPMDLE